MRERVGDGGEEREREVGEEGSGRGRTVHSWAETPYLGLEGLKPPA